MMPELSSSRPEGSLAFCQFTGQVYRECPSNAAKQEDWTSKSIADPSVLGKYRHPRLGAASLQAMAIRSVCLNSRLLTPKSLEGVPYRLGRLVWKVLAKNHLDSFNVWKIFVMAFGADEGAKVLKYRKSPIDIPDLSLSSYCNAIGSQANHWLTILHLKNIKCRRSDIICISQLQNLLVLGILENVNVLEDAIDDSIIRVWARDARDNGGFRSLHILLFADQHSLTGRSLSWISDLPQLDFLVLQGTYLYPQEGWSPVTLPTAIPNSDALNLRAVNSTIRALLQTIFDNDVDRADWPLCRLMDIPIFELPLGGEPGRSLQASARIYQRDRLSVIQSTENSSKRRIKSKESSHSSNKRRLKYASHRNAADSLREFGT